MISGNSREDLFPAILIINSPFRGLGGLVAMSLPLKPLKGTYKEFTSDIYNKKGSITFYVGLRINTFKRSSLP